MNVREFNLERALDEWGKSYKYISDLTGKEYEVMHGPVIKLDPIRREDVAEVMQKFKEKVRTNDNNYDECPIDFGTNEHFHFRYKLKSVRGQIGLRFRTSSENESEDNFLNCYNEALIIYSDCDTRDLIKDTADKFDELYNKSLQKCLSLIDSPKEETLSLNRRFREDYIRSRTSTIFSTFHFLSIIGEDLSDHLDFAQNLIIPGIKKRNDPIWEETLSVLRKPKK